MRRAILFLSVLFASLALSCQGEAPGAPAAPRWVSLAPSTTELLFALGAGPEVVGVCAPADFPPEARALPAVAGFARLDAERVLALRPRAVFTVEGMQDEAQLAPLLRSGVPVVVYPARSLEDLFAAVTDLGARTGRRGAAGILLAELRAAVAESTPPAGSLPVRAAVVVSLEPLVVAGGRSFLTDMLRTAGFANALDAPGEAYPTVSLETLAAAHPRAVIFPAGDIEGGASAAFVARLNRLLAEPAVGVEIPADLLVRPGPRAAEGLRRLAEARRGVTP